MMTNTMALRVEHPRVVGKLLLSAMLIMAVALTPKQARADHAETAAAVLIGAAVLYAAHDAYKSDKKHNQRHVHVHDRRCGHHVAYRGNDHDRYGNAHTYYRHSNTWDHHPSYYSKHQRHSEHYYGGKHHKYVDQKHGGKHAKKYAEKHHKNDRYVRDEHRGKQYYKDTRHGTQSWNTRVKISQNH